MTKTFREHPQWGIFGDILRTPSDGNPREVLSLTNNSLLWIQSDPSRPNWWGLTKFHNFGQISQSQPNFATVEYLEYLVLGQFRNFCYVFYFVFEAQWTCALKYVTSIDFEVLAVRSSAALLLLPRPGWWLPLPIGLRLSLLPGGTHWIFSHSLNIFIWFNLTFNPKGPCWHSLWHISSQRKGRTLLVKR